MLQVLNEELYEHDTVLEKLYDHDGETAHILKMTLCFKGF